MRYRQSQQIGFFLIYNTQGLILSLTWEDNNPKCKQDYPHYASQDDLGLMIGF
jgi:hypothetical protein